MIKDIPFYLGPTYRPPPKPLITSMPGISQSSENANIDPESNIAFEENSPSSGRHNLRNILKARQVILSKTLRISRFDQFKQFDTKISTNTA